MLALAVSVSLMLSRIQAGAPAESPDLLDSVDFIGLSNFSVWLELGALSDLFTLACV